MSDDRGCAAASENFTQALADEADLGRDQNLKYGRTEPVWIGMTLVPVHATFPPMAMSLKRRCAPRT